MAIWVRQGTHPWRVVASLLAGALAATSCLLPELQVADTPANSGSGGTQGSGPGSGSGGDSSSGGSGQGSGSGGSAGASSSGSGGSTGSGGSNGPGADGGSGGDDTGPFECGAPVVAMGQTGHILQRAIPADGVSLDQVDGRDGGFYVVVDDVWEPVGAHLFPVGDTFEIDLQDSPAIALLRADGCLYDVSVFDGVSVTVRGDSSSGAFQVGVVTQPIDQETWSLSSMANVTFIEPAIAFLTPGAQTYGMPFADLPSQAISALVFVPGPGADAYLGNVRFYGGHGVNCPGGAGTHGSPCTGTQECSYATKYCQCDSNVCANWACLAAPVDLNTDCPP